jgi:hypothetical protein
MKTKKMNLANIQGKLSRNEMKNLNGGLNEFRCLGCTKDSECAAVNKGTCTKECQNGGYGCSQG